MKVYPLIYFYFVEFCKLSMNQKRGLKFRNVDFGNTWIFLEHFWMNKKILCEAIYIVCAPYYVFRAVYNCLIYFKREKHEYLCNIFIFWIRYTLLKTVNNSKMHNILPKSIMIFLLQRVVVIISSFYFFVL